MSRLSRTEEGDGGMADSTHTLSRLWLRQRRADGVGHISPGCSHHWGDSLCGVDDGDLSSERGITSVCEACRTDWKRHTTLGSHSLMLPRGDQVLLLDSGALLKSHRFNDIGRRAQSITRDLHPLSPEALGPLGVMDLSRGGDGLLHGDVWCAEYADSAVESLPVGMVDGSASPHHEGVPLHCWRGLPQRVEDAFFTALSVCRARNGVLGVMEFSGWGLHEAIRHENGMHGADDEVVCESGAFEVVSSLSASGRALEGTWGPPVALLREHERSREVWGAIERVMSGWESTREACSELGRVSLMLALSAGGATPLKEDTDASEFLLAIRSLTQFGIQNDGVFTVLNVCQVRMSLGAGGWTSPLSANRRLVEDEVVPRLNGGVPAGRESEVAADLTDFMVTQDHAFWSLSDHYVHEVQGGVLVEVELGAAPSHWALWPHGVDPHGRRLVWVPEAVAEIAPLGEMGAALAPFMPMTFREAETLLRQPVA